MKTTNNSRLLLGLRILYDNKVMMIHTAYTDPDKPPRYDLAPVGAARSTIKDISSEDFYELLETDDSIFSAFPIGHQIGYGPSCRHVVGYIVVRMTGQALLAVRTLDGIVSVHTYEGVMTLLEEAEIEKAAFAESAAVVASKDAFARYTHYLLSAGSEPRIEVGDCVKFRYASAVAHFFIRQLTANGLRAELIGADNDVVEHETYPCKALVFVRRAHPSDKLKVGDRVVRANDPAAYYISSKREGFAALSLTKAAAEADIRGVSMQTLTAATAPDSTDDKDDAQLEANRKIGRALKQNAAEVNETHAGAGKKVEAAFVPEKGDLVLYNYHTRMVLDVARGPGDRIYVDLTTLHNHDCVVTEVHVVLSELKRAEIGRSICVPGAQDVYQPSNRPTAHGLPNAPVLWKALKDEVVHLHDCACCKGTFLLHKSLNEITGNENPYQMYKPCVECAVPPKRVEQRRSVRAG